MQSCCMIHSIRRQFLQPTTKTPRRTDCNGSPARDQDDLPSGTARDVCRRNIRTRIRATSRTEQQDIHVETIPGRVWPDACPWKDRCCRRHPPGTRCEETDLAAVKPSIHRSTGNSPSRADGPPTRGCDDCSHSSDVLDHEHQGTSAKNSK